ncbi:UDP-glucose/GDP-mannose dehydrogenase family protein, partial [archaeon]|nr:UDP-glucose/GDP-mannose dehydrogenase family protein [archaeon]
MKVGVIGAGYVGLVTGACLSRLHEVTCVDVDAAKVTAINECKVPFYEPGLGEELKRGLKATRTLTASSNIEDAMKCDVIFICVGTPSRNDGSPDLSFVDKCVSQITESLKSRKDGFKVIVVKSTVPPGTTKNVASQIERDAGLALGKDFGIAMNPEFLREGSAVKDFLEPDRIVIGTMDKRSKSVMRDIFGSFNCPFVETDPTTAEMVKYAANAFLSAKISFINEIGN